VFKKTTLIFSILVTYIVLQFLWWEVLLVKQSNENISKEQKIIALSTSDYSKAESQINELEAKKTKRVYMFVGEGTVFLLILLYGIHLVRKSIKRETQLASQQKNFILSVSHELKTPIAATKLQLQTLLKHDLSRDKQQALLQNALYESERLHKLIDNVLLANQIENKNLSVNKEQINISKLLENTIKRYFSDYLTSNKLSLTIQENIKLQADKELLPSVFINLIENAIKYSFENISIEVILKATNNITFLEIKDQGCGISDDEKEKVFTRFFRSGSENTRKTKGTGIGLFIVKSICDLHNASINISDNTPQGSIFKIQF